jgi:YteA family regulatory protein
MKKEDLFLKDYNSYRIMLKEMKDQLERRIQSITERSSISLKDSVEELSSYDNHSPDLASETFERSKDIGLKDKSKILLVKVNHALDQMKDGSYGKCERCGKAIDVERLKAVPYTTLCIDCRKIEEKSDKNRERPVEEEVLIYPFGRSFLDDTDQNQYDGEDAWQDVARFGTSNTPQDEPGAVNYKETYVDGNEKRGIVERTDMIPDENDPDEDDNNQLRR